MNTPNNITCPITYCNYMIITSQQNKDFFQEYFNNTKIQLNNGKKVVYSFRFHSFPYEKYGKYVKILQLAECFNGDLQKNNSSFDLKNGIFLVFPFEKDIKDKLGELFLHMNVTIITYDFTIDVTNLIDEKIPFNFKSIIDGNINRFTGLKMFELPFSSLTTACKKSKNFRPNKNTKSENKNKQNYHTSSEFLYLLQNSGEPIYDLLNNKFWESIVNDCAYVAYACSNTVGNIGIAKIKQFSSEKVKSFCEIQKQYGTFGPFLMKKFFNDDKLLHSTDISSENYAYDLWMAAQNALINNEIYNKIVPKERLVSKSDILNLQKRAEKKILNLDAEPEPIPQPSFQPSSTKSATLNNKATNDGQPNNLNSKGIESWKIISKNIQNEVKTAKKRTGNNRIDWMILEIDSYVKQNLIYLKDLEANWDNLYPNIYNIQKVLQFNEPSFILIEKSIQNIKKYNKLTSKKISSEKKKLITHNVNDILLTVNIFLSFISNTKIKKESKIIEKKLFKVIFNPMDDDSFITKIFSVYQKHDDFIFTQDSIANFKSSTGSGKTRCAPFFFCH